MARRRKRWNRPLWASLLGLLLLAVGYVFTAAWWQSRESYQSFADLLLPRLADVLVAAWLFWIGSSIGSFLNVVAYRLPRGRGVGGFSACPYCNHSIARRDNVPVFGWLTIRGRCRVCRMPISPRYPLVELSVGVTLTLVGWMGVYRGGANLPYFSVDGLRGGLWMPDVSTASLAIGTYHLFALAGSWAIALIRFDAIRLPPRLLFWVLGIVVVPLLVWPPLQIVPWQVRVSEDWRPTESIASIIRLVTGLAAAGVIGRGLGRSLAPAGDIKLNPLGKDTARLLDLIAMLSVPAIVVGWQAFVGVVLVACLGATQLARLFPSRDGLARLAIALPPVFALQLTFWRWIDASPYWPGTRSHPWVMLAAAFAILVVALWLKPRIAPTPAAPELETDPGRSASPETSDETSPARTPRGTDRL